MNPREIPGLGRFSQIIPPNPDYQFFDHQGHPFEPQIDGFQMRTAWWLAEASLLAYCSEDVVRKNFETHDFKFLKGIRQDNTDCYVVTKEPDIIIIFRGTEFISFAEWKRNFEFSPIPWPAGGRVHKGFNKALKVIWENGLQNLLKELRDEPGRKRNFYFTGHSLGGALATLASSLFHFESKNHSAHEFIALYIFGAPRAGNKTFQQNFKIQNAWRIENNSDIVTQAPSSWIYRYRHIGESKYIDRKGEILTNPSRMYRLYDRLMSASAGRQEDENRDFNLTFWIYLVIGGLLDHAPIHYAHRIWNYNCGNTEF